ncbi:hypothetical protein QUB68_08410 [Microcoleus sp. A006_D1]|uniref:hypothetical protein n=1 Tax=Microcoleus sp. A006_D1 TaxID=3055267 RepID=UPI002FD5F6A8
MAATRTENYAETGFLQELLDRPKLKYLGYTVSFGRSRTATLASKSAPIHAEN